MMQYMVMLCVLLRHANAPRASSDETEDVQALTRGYDTKPEAFTSRVPQNRAIRADGFGRLGGRRSLLSRVSKQTGLNADR